MSQTPSQLVQLAIDKLQKTQVSTNILMSKVDSIINSITSGATVPAQSNSEITVDKIVSVKTDGSGDFTTIQNAINSIRNNYSNSLFLNFIIEVADGTYNDTLDIFRLSNIVIRSQSTVHDNVILNPASLHISYSEVTFENITITKKPIVLKSTITISGTVIVKSDMDLAYSTISSQPTDVLKVTKLNATPEVTMVNSHIDCGILTVEHDYVDGQPIPAFTNTSLVSLKKMSSIDAKSLTLTAKEGLCLNVIGSKVEAQTMVATANKRTAIRLKDSALVTLDTTTIAGAQEGADAGTSIVAIDSKVILGYHAISGNPYDTDSSGTNIKTTLTGFGNVLLDNSSLQSSEPMKLDYKGYGLRALNGSRVKTGLLHHKDDFTTTEGVMLQAGVTGYDTNPDASLSSSIIARIVNPPADTSLIANLNNKTLSPEGNIISYRS